MKEKSILRIITTKKKHMKTEIKAINIKEFQLLFLPIHSVPNIINDDQYKHQIEREK